MRLLRPVQWLKNLMLFFPPFLGGTILQHKGLGKGLLAFAAFCLASGASYVLNDLIDRHNDNLHQHKKTRPIASGEVSPGGGVVFGVFIFSLSILCAIQLSRVFLLLLLLYLLNSAIYSIRLKDYPIVDIFSISIGFLIRLHAGGDVFGISISEWLFLSVFLLAVFLSTGKRLSEKNSLGYCAANHRRSLALYPDGFLEGIMYMTGGAVLVTYTMYVITRHFLISSVLLCTFGLLRYILLVKTGRYGDPTESLVKDKVLFIVGFLWAFMLGWGIYVR
jgi:4-hydroxybenzoate polyprenyltransferase